MQLPAFLLFFFFLIAAASNLKTSLEPVESGSRILQSNENEEEDETIRRTLGESYVSSKEAIAVLEPAQYMERKQKETRKLPKPAHWSQFNIKKYLHKDGLWTGKSIRKVTAVPILGKSRCAYSIFCRLRNKDVGVTRNMALKINLDVPAELKKSKQGDIFGPFTATRAACGLYHTFVIGKRADVPQLYGWGRNHNNVLALGLEIKERTFPGQVEHFARSHVFQVSCGLNHTAVLTKQFNQSGGKLYTCGLGNKGRLGYTKTKFGEETSEDDAWFTPKPIRVRFPDKVKIARVTCGADHSLALTDKGELYVWGVGQYGNLGTGETNDEFEPVKIEVGPKDSFVSHCAAGGKHSLACTKNGNCYAWGHNGSGRLGLGHTRAVLSPVQIDYLIGKEIVFVAAGEAHSAAIDRSGSLFTWGAGSFGRLGHGEDTDMPVPRRVEELGGIPIIQVACSTFHTSAVSRTGTLYSWGAGLGLGLLAEGDNTAVMLPRQVTGGNIGTSVCQIAAGTYHSVALTLSGDVFCWGVGGQSRLGHGDSINQAFPKYVAELRNRAFIDDIKASMTLAQGKAKKIAIGTGGEAWRIVQIRCGEKHTMVLTAGGSVWVWGSNANGQLGLGEGQEEDVWEPVELRQFKEPMRAIACGGKHSMAVSKKGDIYVWGDGSLGQLGLGRLIDVFVPTGVANLSGVFDCAAGDDYSACLVVPVGGNPGADSGVVYAEAGSVWTWGSCEAGKLGHEGLSSGSCITPKHVRISSPISKLACGRSHMIVASPNGDVFSWGAGYYGRLGIGSSANSIVPVKVPFPEDVSIMEVAAGAFHSMALSRHGNIWAWGRDTSLGTEAHVMKPELFVSLEGQEGVPKCKTVACNGEHSFAITQNGQTWCWGENKEFQLGLGKKSADFAHRPEWITTLPDECEIVATGPFHSVVGLRGGDMFAWGATSNGCLGVGYKKANFCPAPEAVVAHWLNVDDLLHEGGPDDGGRSGGNGKEESTVLKALGLGQDPSQYAQVEEPEDFKVLTFLDRLRFLGGNDPGASFAAAQQLLKNEPKANRIQELENLEDDLIKIFGRFLDVILKMNEGESQLRKTESLVTRSIGRVIVHIQCDAPATVAFNRQTIPDWYLNKLESIQKLVFCLQTQPAYFVSLGIALRKPYERQVLVSSIRQIFWNVEDRHVNALFLTLCASLCTHEVETAPNLLRLFNPDDSNFIQLLALYATQLTNLKVIGPQLIDPNTEGVGSIVNSLKDTILALDMEKLQELSGGQMPEADLKRTFFKSIDGLRAAFGALGTNLVFPPGVCALLKHAYECTMAHDFVADVYASQVRGIHFYPLVRLLLQGIIARVWKEPLTYNKFLSFPEFDSPTAEINYRTLWVFINSAFEDDFAPFPASHLFREIFQLCYGRLSDLVACILGSTSDDYIKVELTLGFYLSHFDLSSHIVTVRSDVVAAMINLLKDHEAHLHLSVYDPVAEVIKEMAGGQNPIFTREMLHFLEENPYSHNVYIERRDKNVVFDSATYAPVPQKLALRQQAAARVRNRHNFERQEEGRSVLSLVHRYVPPDPLDPRTVIQDALRASPPVSGTDWEDLHREFSVLQEFYTRQEPPKYREAQLCEKAAKYAQDFECQETPTQTVLRWIGEGLRKRQKHRAYLIMIQKGEDDVADVERNYQVHLRKRKEDMTRIIQSVQSLQVEAPIREKMESQNLVPHFDVLSRMYARDFESPLDARPTTTLQLVSLYMNGVVISATLPAGVVRQSKVIFTAAEDGGWTVQIVEVASSGEQTLDQFEITLDQSVSLNPV